ncbi:hypothetical protein [Pseudomonas reactans]
MAINNFFWSPPNVATIPCCNTGSTSPTPTAPAPIQTIGSKPGLTINSFLRVGEFVIADTLNPAGVATEVAGFLDSISTDGKTAVIADGETGATTNVSARFISFYAPVNNVNIYPGQYGGINNNFNGPVYAVNQYTRSATYRAKFLASTRAFVAHSPFIVR